VVNLASTEAVVAPSPDHRSIVAFERALNECDEAVTPGMRYAYAAITAGVPYVNFTPSFTGDVPALVDVARCRGVSSAGKDGKPARPLDKTVLARSFASGISGYEAGTARFSETTTARVLQQSGHGEAKRATKRESLEHILGYNDIDHQVHIHCYSERGDAKEDWSAVDFLGWLETPMSIRVNWQGGDSALAAPLVVDLVRMILVARNRGESGPATHLAFKMPLGTTEHSFFEAQAPLLL
jgi:myo-inositol-1-phosphate synthase